MQMRGLLSVAAMLLTLGTGAALAQEPVIGGDDTNAAPAANAPPAAAWATRCASGARADALECSLIQRAVTKQGQVVGSVTIQLPAGGPARMIVSVPLGFYIGGGVTYDVDGANPAKLDLQTCDRNACYAEIAVSGDMAGAMQNGQKLNITFQNMNKQPVVLPMSLTGFTAAYNKAK